VRKKKVLLLPYAWLKKLLSLVCQFLRILVAHQQAIDFLVWCGIATMTVYSTRDEEKLRNEEGVKVTAREGVVSFDLVENFAFSLVGALG